MSFTIGTATFTNGSAVVTNVVLTSGTTSYFTSGTRMVVGRNPVAAEVEAIAAPTVNTITLRTAWNLPTGSYSFLANQTSEGLRDAVQAVRNSNQNLQAFIDSIDANPNNNTVARRTANGRLKVANATESNDAVALGQLGTAARANVTTSATDVTAGRLLKVGDFGLSTSIGGVNIRTHPVNSFLSGGAGNQLTSSPDNGFGSAIKFGHPSQASDYYAAIYRSHDSERWFVTGSYGQGVQPWCELYHNRNILGTVSQSGGAPTGAIIQRGSNANGEFVRFADGTQICWRTVVLSGAGQFPTSVGSRVAIDTAYPTPVSFSTPPTIQLTATAFTATYGGGARKAMSAWIRDEAISASSLNYLFTGYGVLMQLEEAQFNPPNRCVLYFVATGRWF